jgi:hypothetical protein
MWNVWTTFASVEIEPTRGRRGGQDAPFLCLQSVTIPADRVG